MAFKAVFVDRDGTINVNVEYLDDPKKLKIYPGVAEGLKKLKENSFKIIVITNQSGIARGFFSEERLKEIHQKMREELSKKGATIDGIYYCPHHPADGCSCRKPETALFHRAARDFNLDLKISWVVGDSWRDIEAGRRIGAKTILVKSGPSRGNEDCDPPDSIAENLLEAANLILSESGRSGE